MKNSEKIKFLCVFIFSFSICCVCLKAQFAIETLSGEEITGIPQGAVPFKDYRGAIILDGMVNDTVQIKAHFDTGAWGIAVPVRFKSPDNMVKLKIGEWENSLKASYLEEGNTFLNWFGGECVLFGWDFFDGKIVEVSYRDYYLRVLQPQDLQELEGYNRVDFRNKGKRLILTADVKMQGKYISGDFWIDTGLNGLIFFTHNIPELYNLTLDDTKAGRAKNMYNNQTKIDILVADTVRIGDSFVIDRDILFPQSEWFVFKPNDLYIGLLGNQFFHNFSVVFDFRKNQLYLKPFED